MLTEKILNKTYQFAKEYHSKDNSGHEFMVALLQQFFAEQNLDTRQTFLKEY